MVWICTFYIFIHLLMDMSCFHFLDIINNVAITFVCMFLCGYKVLFLLGIYVKDLLDHMVTRYFIV